MGSVVFPPPVSAATHWKNGEEVENPPTIKEQLQGSLNPKQYQDILAYEDKWVGWDGPVWCKRFGRFESKDDAAKDDGYTHEPHKTSHFSNPNHLYRCTHCESTTPLEHVSSVPYVHDITRRIEPMVASLVNLEHRVATMMHHGLHNGGMHGSRHDGEVTNGADYAEKNGESMPDTIARLQAQVDQLTGRLNGQSAPKTVA